MKRQLTLLLALCLCTSVFGQDWEWKTIGKGAQTAYASVELFGSKQSISVLRYRRSAYRTEVINDPAEQADSISVLASRHGAVGAVNGSYFNVRELTPATFVKDDGVQEGTTDSAEVYRTDGVIILRGRHKVSIGPFASSSGDAVAGRCREALASGPLLLQDGHPVREEWPEDSFFTKRHPRTLMGIGADAWIYFVVIDGRAPGQADGATIAEAVQIARMLDLKDAINLDGGGSSTLWTESDGVLSHPCDNKRFDHFGQRAIPNAVIFR